MKNDWELLGIESTNNTSEIKKAFAEKSKLVHPEEDPEGFMRLQQAYKNCIKFAEFQKKNKRNESKDISFIFSNSPLLEDTSDSDEAPPIFYTEKKQRNTPNEDADTVNLESENSVEKIQFDDLEKKFNEFSAKEQKSVKKIRESIRSLLRNEKTCNNVQAWINFFNSPLFLDNQNNELVILELCAVIKANKNLFTTRTWEKAFRPFFLNLKNEWTGTYVEKKIDDVIKTPRNMYNAPKTKVDFRIVIILVIVVFLAFSVISFVTKEKKQKETQQKVQSSINYYSTQTYTSMYEILPITDEDWQLMEQEQKQRTVIRGAIKFGFSFSDVEDAANLLLLSEEEYNTIAAAYALNPEDYTTLEDSLRGYGPHEQEVISQLIKPVIAQDLSTGKLSNTGFFCLNSLDSFPRNLFILKSDRDKIKNEVESITHFCLEIIPLKGYALPEI